MPAWRFAYCPEQSCRLQMKLGAYVCGPWSNSVIYRKDRNLPTGQSAGPDACRHDALEFPDGKVVLLTFLKEGQQAIVLQLPAAAVGAKVPQRAAYV